MAQPDPARVHAAMVLAFAEREKRPEEEVRDLLFEKGYTAEEIMTALANLPPLPRGFKPPPPRTRPLPAPAPKAKLPEPPKTEAPKAAETRKLPPPKEKAALLPLPPGSGKAPPGQAKRGKPTQGAWLFAAASGLVLLVLILAFSCGRTPPPPMPGQMQPTGPVPDSPAP